jgi:phosphoribosylanthranilate isomerase
MTKLTSQARAALPAIEFAFQAQRKEPLEDASHVRSAVARFHQVTGVSDAERSVAWRRILGFAKKYGVQVHDTSWRDVVKPAS